MSALEQQSTSPSGLFVLDKPEGISSARALNAIKRALPRKTKVGHAGTLDPFATGVLVVLIGKATKQCERVMGLPKGYETTLRLGVTTDTFDPEGQITRVVEGAAPTRDEVEAVLPRFIGEIEQIPPAFSAIKVQGKRAYDLARGGAELELPPRPVRVDELKLVAFEPPDVRITMKVGRGFYVRSLARDLGEALGTGGHLTALRRTAVGPFTEHIAAGEYSPDRLLPIDWLERRQLA